ncbi:YncE family protein [Dactylosporangium sp. CA-233914]|uniref:YncE family protein n=1 Tax=Dactylosporangium sp. CA-233914 TaxID=3239934 RepID=UPI003D8DCF83
MLRRLLPPPIVLAGALLLTACDAGAPSSSHPDATMPTPTWAPTPSADPDGTAARLPEVPIGVALSTDLVAISDKSAFVRHEPATSFTELTVTAKPRSVVAVPGGGFRAVVGSAVLDLPPGPTGTTPGSGPGGTGTTPGGTPAPGAGGTGIAAGRLWPLPGEGGAIAVPRSADWTAVALPAQGDVIILSSGGQPVRTIHTGGRPAALAADDERIAVIDAGQSSLTVYDAATGARQEALRAGDGAVSVAAVGAPGGPSRFAVIDARDGELLIYDTGPLLLRQRYPVPGGAWGVASDPRRRVLWVTVTQRNEVVGYDVSGGTPREVARHRTVRLPLAVAVDEASGDLAVAGSDATGAEGLVQRIAA